MLTPEQQTEILARFYNEKQAVRAIARAMGVNRDSVRRVVKRRSVNLVVQSSSRSSILDPFMEEVKAMLTRDPSCMAPAILNRLRDLGYMGGVTVIRDYLQRHKAERQRPREAFLRLEFQPGQTAQVDWGEFGDVFHDGVKIHCFGMVLCFSRYIYLEFTRSEKFEDFIRAHENAFRFFGGVPRECWYDNLRSAVTDRVNSLIQFNARFMAYMGHHGIRPHACNVARGNEKGRVEDLIKYIRMNFWAGRVFADFEDLTRQAILWRNQVANQREHRSTRRVVRLHFESEEKAHLLKLNPSPYDTDEIFSRVVTPDFHIIYESNRYSVPWTLVGITVTVRVNSGSIKIFYHEKFITSHPRSYRKNQVLTQASHQAGLLERKPGGSREGWQLAAVKSIGPKMQEYVDLLRTGPRSLRAELSKILALSTVYGDPAVHNACAALLQAGVVGVEALELTLKRLHHPGQSKLHPEPIHFQNSKLNRSVRPVDLRQYDALLLEARNPRASELNERDDADPTRSE
jgi:transposase